MSKLSVMCVGVATLDTIAAVADYPHPDSRVVAEAVVQSGGGPAATAAVACVRLGVAAGFIGAVGDDGLGEAILAGLRAEGVDVSAVLRLPAPSGASVIIVDRGRGSRAICNRPGPAFIIAPDSPAATALAAADWVHVDQAGWAAIRGLSPARLSVDAGNAIAGYHPGSTALFAPTLAQLQVLFGARPVPALLRAALAAGAQSVVATDGRQGCFAASGSHAWHVPALELAPLSTLGAGDVFHGALLAASVHGFDLPTCAAYANIAAALSCRGLDGRSAIPRHDQVMGRLAALHPQPLELPSC